MNNSGPERVERLIWEEIARDLERERGVERCLCFPDRFRDCLRGAALNFPVDELPVSGPEPGIADLILGWEVISEAGEILAPEAIHAALRQGGEARLFGFYGFPRPDDLREWEGRVGPGPLRLPPPGSVSLGRVAGWLKTGPFSRYTIRKRGIYYDCRLQKDA